MKVKKTITIDKDLLEWIEQKIREKEFGSVSHAIEKALTLLRNQYERTTHNALRTAQRKIGARYC